MVRHIDVDTMARLAESDDAVVVDCMPAESFESVHIPGAINIPFDDPDDFAAAARQRLDPQQTVVTYCRDEDCDLSPAAAHLLEDHLGFRDVREFDAGLVGWRRAGHEFAGKGPKKVRL